MIHDILIYEYNNNYFVIQRSQQGTTPNDKNHQYPSENVELFIKFDISCSDEEIGKSIMEALDKFDTVRPKYEPWELKELNTQLCSWVGARGINVLNKNSRLVQVIKDGSELSIVPFDNYNKNPWYGPMTKKAGFGKDILFTATSDSSYETIGRLVLDAFNISTYNPERKDKK
jgi:hypothetical protein